ncbi:hypothetical protein [Streptomyces sp. NPDC002463]|uniref:hypothetical protein n=1 Tax=Streptomyces sp. NPDC002463 TaxID=3364645 RepID=UPI00368D7110
MTDGGETVWLPHPPNRIPGLPAGLSHAGRNGSAALPGDVRFPVGERVLIIGCGAAGTAVAARLEAFRCEESHDVVLTAPGTHIGEQAA